MEQAIDLVEQLAQQLGVAAAYLWEVLVKQQYAEGITSIIMAVSAIAVITLLAVYTPKIARRADDEYKQLVEDRRTNHTGYEGTNYIPSFEEDRWDTLRKSVYIIALIIGAIACLIFVARITSGIQQVINPEYFALEEILDVIHSS